MPFTNYKNKDMSFGIRNLAQFCAIPCEMSVSPVGQCEVCGVSLCFCVNEFNTHLEKRRMYLC